MKSSGVRWMLAAGLVLAALCLCSRPGAVPRARAQTSGTKAGASDPDQAASVWVPEGNGWKEAPNAAMHLRGLIRLDVTVHDAAGDAIAGLGRDDFTVLDNGHPESLVAFRPSPATGGPSPDASVVVLLDTLALPPELAAEERQQVVAFLRVDGGRLRWPVTVYTFEDSGFYRTAEPSQDGNTLADAVLANAKKDPLPLQTPVPAYSPVTEDAVQRVSQLLQSNAEAAPPSTGVQALATIAAEEDLVPGRKVLLWVGPGLRGAGTGAYPDPAFLKLAVRREQQSRTSVGDYTPSEVTEAPVRQAIFDDAYWIVTLLRQAGITVDVFSVGEQQWRRKDWSGILDKDNEAKWMRLVNVWKPHQDGLDRPEQANRIDLYKKVLAVESGGQVLPDEKDIAQQMAACVRAADTWYTLTFDPAPAAHADDLHALEVKVRPPGLTAETVREYYDEPYYSDPPYGGAQPVTIAGLESLLHAAHGGNEQVRALEGVALTERLTQAEQAKLRARLHGGKPQEALDMLADEAEFKPPPKSEALPDPAPDAAEQLQMLARAQQYLDKTIPRLPDFFAVRQTERFTSTAAFHRGSTSIAASPCTGPTHGRRTWSTGKDRRWCSRRRLGPTRRKHLCTAMEPSDQLCSHCGRRWATRRASPGADGSTGQQVERRSSHSPCRIPFRTSTRSLDAACRIVPVICSSSFCPAITVRWPSIRRPEPFCGFSSSRTSGGSLPRTSRPSWWRTDRGRLAGTPTSCRSEASVSCERAPSRSCITGT